MACQLMSGEKHLIGRNNVFGTVCTCINTWHLVDLIHLLGGLTLGIIGPDGRSYDLRPPMCQIGLLLDQVPTYLGT